MLLAKYPYHSGRTEDLRATIDALHERCPNSPLSMIGFSMGGNIALKYLGKSEAAGADAGVVQSSCRLSADRSFVYR